MGKRTKEKTDEEIERKIRRLEKELHTRRRPLPSYVENEDGDWDTSSYNYRDELELDAYPVHSIASEDDHGPVTPGAVLTALDVNPQNTSLPLENRSEESQNDPVPNSVNSVVISSAATALTDEVTVPDEIMEVLGEAKKSEEIFGKKIPQSVSERLGKILTEGLAKEQKETLLTKTLIIPENFQLAKAPKLNAEVASVLTDPAKNRDKRLEKLQNQLGSGIAGLVNLTTELINKDINKMEIIKRVSEVNQILLDLHYEETMSRRRLIIPMLDNSFINIIQNVKRDQFLFGDNLGENIKTSKSIEKSSLQIKKSVPPQPSTSRKQPLSQPGNSRAPARRVNGPNTARTQPSTSRYYPQPPPPPSRRPPAAPARRPPPQSHPRGHSQEHRSRRR